MSVSLRERLMTNEQAAPQAATFAGETGMVGPALQALKARLHQTILDRLDLERLQQLQPERVRDELQKLTEKLLAEEAVALNESDRASLVREIQNEMLGLGPLEALLADPTISDILVNTHSSVYVERHGKLERTSITFADDGHLMKIIDKIVSRIGRRVDESSPMVDARLPDGSRVNAIIPPLAIDGPILSIRRFAVNPLTMRDFLAFKTLTREMAQILESLVRAKVNFMISGGTGSGKTTLLNILSSYIPGDERIVTIEDAAELQMQQPHVVRLETRPANIEGRGEVTQRALVRNALRMRPDRIVLGEVRGAEALDMLQAMNTGHEGSMTTIHANSPRDSLTRLENMIGMAGMNLPPKAMRHQISSALSVVLQIARLTDGRRKIVSLQELFAFRQTGIDDNGVVSGYFCATGVRPHFTERVRSFGLELPDALFDPTKRYE